MALYLLISEGASQDARSPVFATRDAAIIAAVGREIARRLGADSAVVRKLRTHVRPVKAADRLEDGALSSRE